MLAAEMATTMMLRTPAFVPLSCKSATRARPSRHLLVSCSARQDPTPIFTSPISKTLLAISRICAHTQALARAMVGAFRKAGARPQTLAQPMVGAFQKAGARPTATEQALITALRGNLSVAGAVGCFAAISSGSVNTPLTVVASGMAKWLELYSGVLMLRVLLSWFPNIPWERQPLQAIRDMCDPYLNLFRNIIPPLFNALDVSPLLAFLVLGVLTSTLNTALQA